MHKILACFCVCFCVSAIVYVCLYINIKMNRYVDFSCLPRLVLTLYNLSRHKFVLKAVRYLIRRNVQLIQLVYIHCIQIIYFYRYKNLDQFPLVKTQRQKNGSFCIPLSRNTSRYLVNLRNRILHFSMH